MRAGGPPRGSWAGCWNVCFEIALPVAARGGRRPGRSPRPRVPRPRPGAGEDRAPARTRACDALRCRMLDGPAPQAAGRSGCRYRRRPGGAMPARPPLSRDCRSLGCQRGECNRRPPARRARSPALRLAPWPAPSRHDSRRGRPPAHLPSRSGAHSTWANNAPGAGFPRTRPTFCPAERVEKSDGDARTNVSRRRAREQPGRRRHLCHGRWNELG